jgi:hypothetical protein
LADAVAFVKDEGDNPGNKPGILPEFLNSSVTHEKLRVDNNNIVFSIRYTL